jgi:PAS domain S-box-containing protein
MPDGRSSAAGPPRREPFVDRRAVEIPELLVRGPDAVLLLDADATVLDVNEEACLSLGYAREELLGRRPRDFVDGLDGPTLEHMMAVLKERGVASFTAMHRRKDGTRFPVETRLAVLRRGGPPVIVAFARDVSEQEAARRALRESEARYERLVELLPDGVVTFRDGRITFANPAAATLGGMSRPVLIVGDMRRISEDTCSPIFTVGRSFAFRDVNTALHVLRQGPVSWPESLSEVGECSCDSVRPEWRRASHPLLCGRHPMQAPRAPLAVCGGNIPPSL